MKSISSTKLVASALVAALSVCVIGPMCMDALAQVASPAATESVPVEPDMHEFMEYAFQPVYLRLQAQMAAQPAGNPAWKAIKSDSLILAEGGNLLLMRQPEKDAQQWRDLSVQVRTLGGQLYQSAKKKDYKSARQHYEAMLIKCNACHQHFADGEHQLKP